MRHTPYVSGVRVSVSEELCSNFLHVVGLIKRPQTAVAVFPL